MDPAKLHGCNDERIAYEFDLWMKRSRSKPNTWRLLSITPEQGAVEDRLVSSLAFNPPPGVLSTHGRQMGDLVLAAVAEIEFSIEPFELSYGESHLESLRQMVAEEIANLLGIFTGTSDVWCVPAQECASQEAACPAKLHDASDCAAALGAHRRGAWASDAYL